MALQLYNTLTRTKELFKPLKGNEVRMYACGPTVYWYQTIGNLRRYIFEDILKRTLLYNKFKVKQVMNVTDVGHLTSDSDSGEDKMEKAAAKEGKKAEDIANYYWQVFKSDFKKLNISEPDIWCKATEHINEQIELVKKLEAKGFTYRTADGIYFDTSKLKDYGKLARLKIEGLEAGTRIEMKDKKNPTDFALWKFSESPGKRQQEWPSPWQIGYPGWHIECSAMSMKYLGETFDIHTGGIDHIPVHHTNEIAQTEAATGKKFVNFWLHSAFLTFKGEKVSKSTGGLYTISELEEEGYKPLQYRYFVLGAHYRSPLDFSLENLDGAKNAYERLKNIVSEMKDDGKTNEKYLSQFEDAMNDDLNTPKALTALWEMIRDEKAEGKVSVLNKMEEIFALDLFKKEKIDIPAEVKKLAEERENARKAKDWKKSDELREAVKKKGFEIKDTKEGYVLTKLA
jgi:cysteinyl-tRNA synthetase